MLESTIANQQPVRPSDRLIAFSAGINVLSSLPRLLFVLVINNYGYNLS